MSNGLKVGILVVVAGALGFLGYTQFKKSGNDIESRPVEVATAPAGTDGASATTNNAMGAENGSTTKLSETRAKTTMTYDKTEHNFGTIKQGDQVECVFKITNTGKEPLIIEEARGSCGCTVPDYPKDPIPAGESRDMKVKFNSAGKSGDQNKTVYVTSNTDPIESQIHIKANVDAPETKEDKKKK